MRFAQADPFSTRSKLQKCRPIRVAGGFSRGAANTKPIRSESFVAPGLFNQRAQPKSPLRYDFAAPFIVRIGILNIWLDHTLMNLIFNRSHSVATRFLPPE